MIIQEKSCPVCIYGSIGYWRCSDGKTIVLICNECDSVWLHPENIDLENLHISTASDDIMIEIGCSLTGNDAGYATREDIERQGWQKQVRNQGRETTNTELPPKQQGRNIFTSHDYQNFLRSYRELENGNMQIF
jgi:hypothetical protein